LSWGDRCCSTPTTIITGGSAAASTSTLKVLQLSGRERMRDGFPMLRKPFSEEDLARVMQQATGVC
jgi:hypothetical protein